MQPRRRLRLTATLVREDGREDDVFALIGPKKADVPWKVLEHQGWIPCPLHGGPSADAGRTADAYAVADARSKFRIASENPHKLDLVRRILDRHPHEPALVIGMYLDQLQALAGPLGLPVLTGTTPQRQRDRLFADFREGRIRVLAMSRVANFAVDLRKPRWPSRSRAASARGRRSAEIGSDLRPKSAGNQAHFYTLVSRDTVEQDYALKRQYSVRAGLRLLH